jgi:diguanylate cyclase (GGDEF)-like protein
VKRALLSDMLALATFIGSFWPLARRAGRHTRVWLLGWTFMLLRNLALLMDDDGSPHGHQVLRLAALWSIELCGLCFLRAAGSVGFRAIPTVFLVEIGAPILIESALSVFAIDAPRLSLVCAAALAAPALHLLLRHRERSASLIQLAVGFALLAVVSVRFILSQPGLVLSLMLCGIFLAAAWHSFSKAAHTTRGVVIAAFGLAGWGLSYPIAWFMNWDATPNLGGAGVMDLPQYFVACGMILSLIEQHVGKTEQLALADPLTGLANLRHFEDRLAGALASASAHGNPIACLVIDVDDFKRINDSLGHPIGDELLKALSVRLAWHIGPRDTLARTGGDEFTALLVGETDEHHLLFIARAMMSAACVPLNVRGHEIPVKLSIGIAVSTYFWPNLSELRRAADEAMYVAKRNGGGHLALAGSPG